MAIWQMPAAMIIDEFIPRFFLIVASVESSTVVPVKFVGHKQGWVIINLLFKTKFTFGGETCLGRA